MYQDLSTRHDCPVKKTIVNLPIRLRGNSKRISGNSLSPSATQNKDISAVLQTLLKTGFKLHLQCSLTCELVWKRETFVREGSKRSRSLLTLYQNQVPYIDTLLKPEPVLTCLKVWHCQWKYDHYDQLSYLALMVMCRWTCYDQFLTCCGFQS